MEENIQHNTLAHDIAKEIRQGFRTLMNGPLSESMRDKGLDYRVNWGVTLPHLMEYAKDYTPNLHVALDLWKDHVRESKLMALMLMPKEDFTADLAQLWSETLLTQEIAEMAAMLLYQHLDYAPQFAFRALAMGDKLQQILAYNILSRLFSRDMIPNERGLNELLDQAAIPLASDDIALKHTVINCLNKLSQADDGTYAPVIDSFLEKNNIN